MTRFLVHGALLVGLLGTLPAGAEELRVTTLYRIGTLTGYFGSANIVVRDVAGDARPEIVSCSNGFAFAMSYDGATYRDAWYSPPAQCSAVAVGDRDHSGRNSVFVGSSVPNTPGGPSFLYAFDATSYGPELAKVQVSATEGVNDVAVGNVDGDPDLEVVAVTNTRMFVFNAATFGLEWSAPYGGHTVGIGDLEGDGKNEIVIAGSDGYVLNGYTQTYKWGYIGGFGSSVVVADVDNDGRAEIVGGTTSSVKIINGDTMTLTTLPLNAQYIAVGDANNDGQNELIVGRDQYGSVEGYSVSGTKLWSMDPGPGVQGVAVGDPDDDGANEVLWGSGGSLFAANANSHTIESPGMNIDGTFRVATGDLNGDGRLEMVITSGWSANGFSSGGMVYILDCLTRRLITKFKVSFRVEQVALGQVDGDAAREIILLGSGSIQVFDGVTFQQEWSSTPPPCCSAPQISSSGLVVRDLNGDGVDEILFATTDNKIQVLNGATPFVEYTSAALDNVILDFDAADLDGDGVPDLVVGIYGGVYVFKTSDWSQRAHILLSNAYPRVAAMPGHFSVTSSNGVATYSGTALTQEWSCPSSVSINDLAFVSIAGRQRLAASMNDNTVRFFPLNGNSCPTYETISQPVNGAGSSLFAFTDIDGDGRPEMLAGGYADFGVFALGWNSEPRGDVDSDGVVTDADIDALAAYFYGNRTGAQPAADVNGDGAIRPDDLYYLINYRRGTGPPPPQ